MLLLRFCIYGGVLLNVWDFIIFNVWFWWLITNILKAGMVITLFWIWSPYDLYLLTKWNWSFLFLFLLLRIKFILLVFIRSLMDLFFFFSKNIFKIIWISNFLIFQRFIRFFVIQCFPEYIYTFFECIITLKIMKNLILNR